jgi:hypothetical protein
MADVFAAGDVVRLVGLFKNPSLNGALGTIVGDLDESRGRYNVHLQSPAAAVDAHPSGISLSPLNIIRLMGCARPHCHEVGIKTCSVCLKEYYCCGKCQKEIGLEITQDHVCPY